MATRQLYYTSCVKGTSGGAGFQVKALSPDMPAEDRAALIKLLGYRIPPTLPADDVPSHPVSLRYRYAGPGCSMLVCSRSSGPDDGGRPGNFFAHAVVTHPEDFQLFAPIMFWEHPFWKRDDPSADTELATLGAFDLEPSYDDDAMWAFLAEGERADWFARLLPAVLQHGTSGRPVVIVDTADHVAHWVAALSFALPAALRPLLSFATYHHDPYGAPFVVTGTTADSQFRCSADEYLSYFVLNAAAGRISEGPDSLYARHVCPRMTPERYEELMEFFAFCAAHAGTGPLALGAPLDRAVTLFQVLRERSIPMSAPAAREAVQQTLRRLAGAELGADDVIDDLDDLVSLCEANAGARDGQARALYLQALHASRRLDPNHATHCAAFAGWLVRLVCEGDEASLRPAREAARDLFDPALLAEDACRSALREDMPASWSPQGGTPALLAWTILAPLLVHATDAVPALTRLATALLQWLDTLPAAAPPTAPALAAAVSFAGREPAGARALLAALASWPAAGSPAFMSMYAAWTWKLPLKQRPALRHALVDAHRALTLRELVAVEVDGDFGPGAGTPLAERLEAWMRDASLDPALQRGVVEQVTVRYFAALPAAQRAVTAGRLLAAPWFLERASSAATAELVKARFPQAQLRVLDAAGLALAEAHGHHPALSTAVRAALKGCIAMTKGEFQEKSIVEVQGWLAGLDGERYSQEVEALMQRFFDRAIRLEGHISMLQSAYVSRHQARFWDAYWRGFKRLALDPESVGKAIDLLSFWFDGSLPVFQDRPYLGPSFFMQLPAVLEALRDEKEVRHLVDGIAARSAALHWHALARTHLDPALRKRRFQLF